MTAGPSLADSLAALNAEKIVRGPRCAVARILEVLPEADAAALTAAIDSETVGAGRIADLLSGHGYAVQGQTVNRHRKRSQGNGCACPR